MTAADVRVVSVNSWEIRSSDGSPGKRPWAGVWQSVERLPASTSSAVHLGMVSPVCNLSTGEVEVQGHPWAQRKTKPG